MLDRRTGDLLSADPFADVTWAERVDLESGRPIGSPEARYRERGAWVSPAPFGAHNWPPMSWSPATGLAYIPGENNRTYYISSPSFDPGPMRMNTGVGNGLSAPAPGPAIEPPAFLTAWDPVAAGPRWTVPLETRGNGGTLATGGGLVFHAGRDGEFHAYEAETGAVLWEADIGPGPATPITYLAEGRQHVSILSGGRLWTFRLP